MCWHISTLSVVKQTHVQIDVHVIHVLDRPLKSISWCCDSGKAFHLMVRSGVWDLNFIFQPNFRPQVELKLDIDAWPTHIKSYLYSSSHKYISFPCSFTEIKTCFLSNRVTDTLIQRQIILQPSLQLFVGIFIEVQSSKFSFKWSFVYYCSKLSVFFWKLWTGKKRLCPLIPVWNSTVNVQQCHGFYKVNVKTKGQP